MFHLHLLHGGGRSSLKCAPAFSKLSPFPRIRVPYGKLGSRRISVFNTAEIHFFKCASCCQNCCCIPIILIAYCKGCLKNEHIIWVIAKFIVFQLQCSFIAYSENLWSRNSRCTNARIRPFPRWWSPNVVKRHFSEFPTSTVSYIFDLSELQRTSQELVFLGQFEKIDLLFRFTFERQVASL